MPIKRSDLLNQQANSWPSFYKKDLSKLISVILDEMQNALKRSERIELRHIFSLEPRIQKARISRNPQNNSPVNVPEKKNIRLKISKKWAKKINEKV